MQSNGNDRLRGALNRLKWSGRDVTRSSSKPISDGKRILLNRVYRPNLCHGRKPPVGYAATYGLESQEQL
jgi:hypothetical protein